MLSRTQRLQLASQSTASPSPPLISPIKGWNTRDALDAMDPADAVLLDNWYPDANGVLVRNGFTSYATGMGANPVLCIAEFNAASVRKFIAASGGKFYDISSAGAVGAALATGFTNDKWMTVSFNGRLFFLNGADTVQVYNGTAFANATFTGVTLSSLIGGIQYQQRLYFWQSSSTGFWFAPLNAIAGALQFFDLSTFSPNGGNLIAAATYSHDGGNGVLDFICFIMSSGDCLIYYGNDPSNFPNNWQLVGIYRISPPVSALAVCNYGAEAFLTTFDDHVPLQQQLVALKNGALPPRSKASNAVQAAVAANGSAFGWQALYYPQGRRLIFNIPNVDGTFSQHIQNTGSSYVDQSSGTTTSPWCRFQNMNAYRWGLYKNNLFFGGANGTVYQADTGTLDNGSPIAAVGQQAWNTFDSPMRKHVTAIRPLINSNASFNYTMTVNFDYGSESVETIESITGVGSAWDISPWDTSPWSTTAFISTLWHASGGTGVAIAPTLTISANNGATWLRTDFRFENGAYL